MTANCKRQQKLIRKIFGLVNENEIEEKVESLTEGRITHVVEI